jgi:hypothetical protein
VVTLKDGKYYRSVAFYDEKMNELNEVVNNLDFEAEDFFEKVGYTYQLEYISDEEYFLTAEVETKGERHDGDYAFQCKVKKSGEQYVLCELETDDAFPEFTTAKQLTDDEMDEFSERYRNATGSSAGNATGSSVGNDSGVGEVTASIQAAP